MKDQARSAIKLLEALSERAKELTCLYEIEELLKDPEGDIGKVCRGILKAIPPGWQYPEICEAKITLAPEIKIEASLELERPDDSRTPGAACQLSHHWVVRRLY